MLGIAAGCARSIQDTKRRASATFKAQTRAAFLARCTYDLYSVARSMRYQGVVNDTRLRQCNPRHIDGAKQAEPRISPCYASIIASQGTRANSKRLGPDSTSLQRVTCSEGRAQDLPNQAPAIATLQAPESSRYSFAHAGFADTRLRVPYVYPTGERHRPAHRRTQGDFTGNGTSPGSPIDPARSDPSRA